MRTRAALAAIVLAGVCACASNGTNDAVGTSSPTPQRTELTPAEAAKPAVEITYPQEGGDPIAPGDVLMALTVRSFGIVDQMGAEPKKGEGHVVYYLDVKDVPTKAGKSAVAKGDGRSEASAMTSHTWKDVEAGPHRLGVQLVNHDDTPLDPPVVDEIEIVVGG